MTMKTETRLLIADDWEDYALLDSGHLQKLERFGSQTVIRPDPQAFWEPASEVTGDYMTSTRPARARTTVLLHQSVGRRTFSLLMSRSTR